ncbi:MAG: SMC-Scp complex subunit ScpB [Candidatus Falkowbacteria bacterium]
MNLKSQLESLLFVSSKPLGVVEMSDLTNTNFEEVEAALTSLAEEYKAQNRGFILIKNNKEYQLTTAPENTNLVSRFLKDETSGELSQPSLETLTIIAYRGPITKLELERIRGVNCSLILRNLLIRGLIEDKNDKTKNENFYSVTLEFIKFLGISSVSELPDYEKLHRSESLSEVIAQPLSL